MSETIFFVMVMLLALYGCVEIIRQLSLRILSPVKSIASVLVIPIAGHRTDMEYIVRSAATQRRFASPPVHYRVLLMDTGMDTETKAMAERVCREVGCVDMITYSDLDSVVNEPNS